jgi:glutamate dehydrogenase
MDLPAFLQVGLALRAQVGIDTLERGLKLPAAKPLAGTAAQLRAERAAPHAATFAGAGAEARRPAATTAAEAVEVVANTLGLSGYALATDLEQAMLDVWALSEAVNASAAALAA